MARRSRMEARRAKREDAAEQAFFRDESDRCKSRKDWIAWVVDQFMRMRAESESSRQYGLHRRAEVRILEGRMRPVRQQAIFFWSRDDILKDPHKRSLIARQKARRKKGK